MYILIYFLYLFSFVGEILVAACRSSVGCIKMDWFLREDVLLPLFPFICVLGSLFITDYLFPGITVDSDSHVSSFLHRWPTEGTNTVAQGPDVHHVCTLQGKCWDCGGHQPDSMEGKVRNFVDANAFTIMLLYERVHCNIRRDRRYLLSLFLH